MLAYLLEAGKNLGTVLPNTLYSNEESPSLLGSTAPRICDAELQLSLTTSAEHS